MPGFFETRCIINFVYNRLIYWRLSVTINTLIPRHNAEDGVCMVLSSGQVIVRVHSVHLINSVQAAVDLRSVNTYLDGEFGDRLLLPTPTVTIWR